MSDILIRGMEMPNCCGSCQFQASRWTGDFCSAGQFMFDIDFDYRDKHPNCPLVPLPGGHGRLVDEGEIKSKVNRKMSACKPNAVDELTYAVCIDIVDHADTIVPAEGGNADGNGS